MAQDVSPYYASRRHATSAFSLLVDALKYRKA